MFIFKFDSLNICILSSTLHRVNCKYLFYVPYFYNYHFLSEYLQIGYCTNLLNISIPSFCKISVLLLYFLCFCLLFLETIQIFILSEFYIQSLVPISRLID